jgi:hypothetical protein
MYGKDADSEKPLISAYGIRLSMHYYLTGDMD